MIDALPDPQPTKQPTGVIAWFDLPGGRSVCVALSVEEDPLIPTPQEPDVRRMPQIHEWPEILAGLMKFEFTSIQPTFE